MSTRNLNRLIAATTLALAVTLYGCGGTDNLTSSLNTLDDHEVTHSDQLSFTIDAAGAQRLIADTVNGEITVRAGSGHTVQVTATREVKANNEAYARSFVQSIDVTAERRGSDVVLDTSYPKPPSGVNVNVDFEITAPPGLAAELVAVNGIVSVRDMEKAISVVTTNGIVDVAGACGPISVVTVNGLITADMKELTGPASFTAVNGNVNVTVRDGELPVAASTTNGTVTVAMHAAFDGRIDAQTANGRADSDFAVTLTETQRNNRVVGTIGEGGSAMITLRATNGDVRLRKVGS